MAVVAELLVEGVAGQRPTLAEHSIPGLAGSRKQRGDVGHRRVAAGWAQGWLRMSSPSPLDRSGERFMIVPIVPLLRGTIIAERGQWRGIRRAAGAVPGTFA
ncbi:hypothetical protein [Phytohabitans suffuscus]|uniref:hypothetical protein n=1 Tax=Phytohabitans suffuscus TaxID=624315 RepID=UPI001562F410|nr:hypothetical protein [Phytohabitans suffuscus]